MIGDRPSQATYDTAYRALGLDQPLIVQYLIYLKRLVTGDFGMSVLTSQPVLTDLLRVFPGDLRARDHRDRHRRRCSACRPAFSRRRTRAAGRIT